MSKHPTPSTQCQYATVYGGERWCDTHDTHYPCPRDTAPTSGPDLRAPFVIALAAFAVLLAVSGCSSSPQSRPHTHGVASTSVASTTASSAMPPWRCWPALTLTEHIANVDMQSEAGLKALATEATGALKVLPSPPFRKTIADAVSEIGLAATLSGLDVAFGDDNSDQSATLLHSGTQLTDACGAFDPDSGR